MFMKKQLPLLCALTFFLFGVPFAQAQFSSFAATNEAVAFGTIFTNGASAQYFLNYSIGTNGVIRGRAVRYDLPAGSASASPRNGTSITVVQRSSRLGEPVKAGSPYGPSSTNLRSPVMIRLSDGAIIKGVVERTFFEGGGSGSISLEGLITYKGSTGSKLSLSNPY